MRIRYSWLVSFYHTWTWVDGGPSRGCIAPIFLKWWDPQHVQNTKRFNFIWKTNCCMDCLVLQGSAKVSNHWVFSFFKQQLKLPAKFVYFIFCVLTSSQIWCYLLLFIINGFYRCCRNNLFSLSHFLFFPFLLNWNILYTKTLTSSKEWPSGHLK